MSNLRHSNVVEYLGTLQRIQQIFTGHLTFILKKGVFFYV